MSVLLVPLVAVALTLGPVQFSGTVGLSGNAEFITGDTLQQPYSNLNFAFNPSLSVFGIPLTTDLLLSTMESDLRQALNKFRVGLDPVSMLRQHLPVPGFVKYLPKIDVGTFSPSYSTLTISGVPVSGFGFDYQPWRIYLAGAGGRTQRAVEGSDTTDPAYTRLLYATKLGFGKQEASHYYVTLLYAHDDSNSVRRNWRLYQPDTANPADTVEVITPQENYLLGMELYLHLYEGILRIESEIAGIELTRDSRLPVENFSWGPDWVERILKPRMSSQVDFAYRVRPVLNVLDTRLYGEVKMIGPGYVSLGATSLRSDNLAYGTGISRDFFDRSLSLSAAISSERDNLIGSKLSTTAFTSVSCDLSVAFPNLPYLSVSYLPYWQQSESLSDHAQVVSASVGHSFTTGNVSHSPSLFGSWQDYTTSDTAGTGYSTLDLGLSHSLGLNFPLSISANVGLCRTAYADSATNLVSFGLTPSYTAFGSWNNSLSLTGSFQPGGKRLDAGLNSSFPIWKICDASASVTHSAYGGGEGSYRQWRLSGSLTRGW